MKKILKWLLIGAVALTLLGGGIFFVGFAMSGFKVEALSMTKYEMQRFEEREENLLTSIKIDYEATDVVVIFDETATSVTVEYPQKQKKNGENISVVTVTETENSLIISEREKVYLWDWIGSFTPTLTVKLPAARTYDLALEIEHGDVALRGKGNVNALSLDMDYGDASLQRAEIVCQNVLRIQTEHGDIEMGSAQAEKMYLSSEYGDLECEKARLQAKEVYIDMEHGDVDIDLLQADKAVFEIEHGDVDIDLLQADKAVFEIEHGDIEASLYGDKADYTVQVEIEYGDTNIRSVTGGNKLLQIFVEHGDVEIDFKK